MNLFPPRVVIAKIVVWRLYARGRCVLPAIRVQAKGLIGRALQLGGRWTQTVVGDTRKLLRIERARGIRRAKRDGRGGRPRYGGGAKGVDGRGGWT